MGFCLPKNLPAEQETRVQFPGQEDPLEKEMATHCSILAWEIPRTEKPSGLHSPWGHKRVAHNFVTKQQQQEQRYWLLFPATGYKKHLDERIEMPVNEMNPNHILPEEV